MSRHRQLPTRAFLVASLGREAKVEGSRRVYAAAANSLHCQVLITAQRMY